MSAILVVVAGGLFALGLTLPMMTFTTMVFFKDTHSLLSVIAGLAGDGSWGLAALVALFSVVIPGFKLAGLAVLGAAAGWRDQHARRAHRAVDMLGKWSMADVFLVALALFAAKATGIVAVFDHAGIYCFAASVVVAMIAGQMLGVSERRTRPAQRLRAST